MKNNTRIFLSLFFLTMQSLYAADQDLLATDSISDDIVSLLYDLPLDSFDVDMVSQADQDGIQNFLQDYDQFSQHERAIALITQIGQRDSIVDFDEDLEFLVNLAPEELEELFDQIEQDLEIKEKESSNSEFNALYTNAIKKVLGYNNMSLEQFKQLSRQRKITLLLKLAPEDKALLPEKEQEALRQLEAKRKKQLELKAGRRSKKKRDELSGAIEQDLESSNLKFNALYANAIKQVLEYENMSLEQFNTLPRERKITLLLKIAPEDKALLVEKEQEALGHLEKKRKKRIQTDRKWRLKRKRDELPGAIEQDLESSNLKFNALYAHAINKILKYNNMTIDIFNQLSAHRKITLLLKLAPEDKALLPEEEQKALGQLEKKRKRKTETYKDWISKRKRDELSGAIELDLKSSNLKFNTLYAHAINKILEYHNMSIDEFNQLSTNRKTTLLLKLTEDDLNELPVEEQEALNELEVQRVERNEQRKNRDRKRKSDVSWPSIEDGINKKTKDNN